MIRAVIHVNHADHQKSHGAAMKAGMERHGIEVQFARFNEPTPADINVVWGYRQDRVHATAQRLLVMERGHLQDRMFWTSCGWGGLGGRATYPKTADGGARWRQHFAHLMKPWKSGGECVVVCGQVPGDAAIYNIDFHAWATRVCGDAGAIFGRPVVYRPHPLSVRLRDGNWHPPSAEVSTRPFAEDLARAMMVVTYNSTAGVEAVLAGVPVVAMDAGSMALPVASRSLEGALCRVDRAAWAHDLAWTGWSMDEITAGTAWEALQACL